MSINFKTHVTKNNGFAPIAILGIIAAILLLGSGGYVWYKKTEKSPKPQTAHQPSAQEETKVVVDETANWKTYQNEKYGFEVKYPQDWVFYGYTEESGVDFLPESEADQLAGPVYLQIFGYSETDIPLDSFLKSLVPHKENNIILNGHDAIQITFDNEKNKYYLFKAVNKKLIYVMIPEVSGAKPEINKIAEKIFSTFKLNK